MAKKPNKKLMEQVLVILRKRGQKAFQIAENAILQEKNIREPVYEALSYFMEESWFDVQHPALLSLTCEAAGGNPEATNHIGAAIVLLAGAADIHDDIIDKSKNKGSKPTVFGRFGKEIALLAGDALLFKGLILLKEACDKLSEKKGKSILNLTKQAFFELGNAEAKEVSYKGKYDLEPREYYKIIEAKAAIAEMSARIGAIVGGGTTREIETLGHYGKTLAILMTIRDDFVDLYEPDELRNRIENECLPLPILYAFRNTRKKGQIVRLLRKNKIVEQHTQQLLDLIVHMKEVQELKKEMQSLIKKEEDLLLPIKRNRITFTLLLRSTVEDL